MSYLEPYDTEKRIKTLEDKVSDLDFIVTCLREDMIRLEKDMVRRTDPRLYS